MRGLLSERGTSLHDGKNIFFAHKYPPPVFRNLFFKGGIIAKFKCRIEQSMCQVESHSEVNFLMQEISNRRTAH
jgi:hypothetical protein